MSERPLFSCSVLVGSARGAPQRVGASCAPIKVRPATAVAAFFTTHAIEIAEAYAIAVYEQTRARCVGCGGWIGVPGSVVLVEVLRDAHENVGCVETTVAWTCGSPVCHEATRAFIVALARARLAEAQTPVQMCFACGAPCVPRRSPRLADPVFYCSRKCAARF